MQKNYLPSRQVPPEAAQRVGSVVVFNGERGCSATPALCTRRRRFLRESKSGVLRCPLRVSTLNRGTGGFRLRSVTRLQDLPRPVANGVGRSGCRPHLWSKASVL